MAKVRVSLTAKEAEALSTVLNMGGVTTLQLEGREALSMDGREEAAFYRAYYKLYEAIQRSQGGQS